MNSAEYTALAKRLEGLTGKPRRAKYLALQAEATIARRVWSRHPSPHAVIIAEMKRACLLPAPGPDISEDDRRKVRNKLKAMRRGR